MLEKKLKTGTVKFFDADRGFGFIVQNEGGEDLFVHSSELKNGPIAENDKVDYEIGKGKKGLCAINVNKK